MKCFLLALVSLCSCSLFAADSPRAERFECQVRALEPVVGEVLDARQLMQDLYAGRADLGQVMAAVQATRAEVEKLVADLNACEPPVPLPAGEAS